MNAASKREIRGQVRSRLMALTPSHRTEASRAICERILHDSAIGSAKVIMAFMPLPDEADITPAIKGLIQLNKTLTVPQPDWQTRAMQAVQLESVEESTFTSDHFGVRVPANGRCISVAQIEAVLVPGLAFDVSGARLGRSAGFYDRFLAGLAASVVKVGVCFDVQIVDNLPTEPHDVPVHLILTERRRVDVKLRA